MHSNTDKSLSKQQPQKDDGAGSYNRKEHPVNSNMHIHRNHCLHQNHIKNLQDASDLQIHGNSKSTVENGSKAICLHPVSLIIFYILITPMHLTITLHFSVMSSFSFQDDCLLPCSPFVNSMCSE